MAGGQRPAGRGSARTIAPPLLRVGVHDLGQARAVRVWAAYHGRTVVLHGLDAAATGGSFWRAVEANLGASVVVECGDRAGTVLDALRAGLRTLGHDVRGPQEAVLDALIAAHGAVRENRRPDLLLAAAAPVAAQLARWSVVARDHLHPAC